MPDVGETQALSRLAVDALDRVVTTPVEQMHRAIARRAFAGPTPARVVHDGVATLVYGALRAGAGAAAHAAGALADRRRMATLERSPRGRLTLSAVNALIGDELEDQRSELAIAMEIPDRAAAPRSPRLALFVHGLGENEDAWRLGGRPAYGARLAADLGHAPLHLRYNTGLRISENGRRLSALLDELVDEWPVPVEELVLVGHSMGGLVLRAACRDAAARGAAWPRLVTHVVYLGTPHLGAPLEQLVNAATRALSVAPESRAFAGILEHRSAGIRDLRRGRFCDEAGDVPLLDGAAHCFVAACTGRDPARSMSGAIGDLLVGVASASGPRGCEVDADRVRVLAGLNHFQLLNHPRVYAELRDWLTGASASATATATAPARS